MESFAKFYSKATPYFAIILLQFGYAGMSIISKFALNQGMSQHVLVVYRHAVATLVMAPFAIVFERPVIDQNLFYTGMKYTTATFSSAMCNVLPAFAFLMAWICRLEKVNIRKVHGQVKIIGTIVTVGGAMLMTFYNGPMIDFPWSKNSHSHIQQSSSTTMQDPIKGSIMIILGVLCWSAFIILQTVTLKSYPAQLSLTTLICLMGTIEGSVVALVLERGNSSVWSIHMDSKFLTAVYSGVICSGVGYYLQGVVVNSKGPVFVTAFSPLNMVIVMIISSFILSEMMFLGRLMGAIVIVIGLYLVLWGKSKENNTLSNHIDDVQVDKSNSSTMTMISEQRIHNQDVVSLDMSKITPTDESV
ncbi:hypothetical protein ACFE04_029533 [Oxalis oulophora]